MNREAYELANRIKTELGTDEDYLKERPGDVEMKRYKNHILQEIEKEKQTKKRNFRGATAAACAAVMLLAGTVFFGDEVHAMVKQISWSIGNALGISSDLADYREVVNTSITDEEYVVTLQEAVATEEKLIISYTVQREDGETLEELMDPSGGMSMENGIYPSTDLYINGKKVPSAIIGGYRFINDEETAVGGEAQFLISDIDLSQENEYEIAFYRDRWNFAVEVGKFEFKADGTDLIADTVRTVIDREFKLPDGVTVTLKEFATNDLEQRISYEFSGSTEYILKVKAVDSAGKQVDFGTRRQGNGSGYMQNGTYTDDDRLDDSVESATMTLYAAELPKESGKMSDDYVQIGESFELELR